MITITNINIINLSKFILPLQIGGENRIRTYSGISHVIYSHAQLSRFGVSPFVTYIVTNLGRNVKFFQHKRNVEQSSGYANDNCHPLSYVSSCGVAPSAFPHNTLNFTRVEHSYKPCRSTSVWSTSCRLLNKSNLILLL